ncbi:type I glyceraldehyde-3-phosphate dehydrogenase [Halomonas piscis]|uniref:type I glyceraldehyde-3-phosphate dehydrogenase n=1 Tax=Halomonas piscis TaxID=3031727 RepID=UPI00289DD481|nr:glyceraldehyde 3-phosphate dehydrogenase NAD-binding domain-containing protein [Halomonas piscis]
MADEAYRYRIAINGYGRIGQCVLRALVERETASTDPTHIDPVPIDIVAINELSDAATISYLTRFDTTHGRFPGTVESDNGDLIVNGRRIRLLSEPDPTRLPWRELDVDLVVECSGSFKDRATAMQHIDAGAKQLLFSQPAESDVDATVVWGINQDSLTLDQPVISAASCTTNCLVPLLTVLNEALGVEHGVTTTIHSAMNDQPVIDAYHQTDLRLTRSAMQSIVPVDTGLARGISRLMPSLAGRFECLHVRVPTINVSAMDLALTVRCDTDAAAVNELLQTAVAGRLGGVLGYTEEPTASSDFNHDPRSGVIDATQTRVAGARLVKLLCWFDNEWGFANRMLDITQRLARLRHDDSTFHAPTTD